MPEVIDGWRTSGAATARVSVTETPNGANPQLLAGMGVGETTSSPQGRFPAPWKSRLAEWGVALRGVDHLPAGYLGVIIEAQGCCLWAVRLDGSDDPPVVQAEDWHSATPTWQPVADRFSTFTLARTWSHTLAMGAE